MQSVKHIHNTGFMKTHEVESLEKSAVSQEFRILNYLNNQLWFTTLSGSARLGKATASEIWLALRKGEHEPLTSFRRALTKLQKDKQVIQLDETVTGYYGKQEHLWTVKI